MYGPGQLGDVRGDLGRGIEGLAEVLEVDPVAD
jgi:hypothetical protein